MSIVKKEHRRVAWPSEVGEAEERFERAFRDMFRDFFAGRAIASRFTDALASELHIEEYMDDGVGVIRAELPGIDPASDVDLSVHDGLLDLRVRREERSEEKRDDSYRTEFTYGSFRRAIPLPDGSTGADVKATYRNGILEVRVPIPDGTPDGAAIRIPIEQG